jgi:hypothetical protein
LIVFTCYLGASSLNLNSIGRGGIDMAIGDSSTSLLLNPANLKSRDELSIDFSNSISLNRRTASFIKELSSNSTQKISNLMNKNIGKSISFSGENFTSIYKTQDDYSWLIGLYNSIEGEFITHTGFGSIGAMESSIDRYGVVITSLAFNQNPIRYGFNLRAVNRHKTLHNYTINEIIESDTILNYFENRYTKNQKAIAFDMGGVYRMKDTQLAVSILDMGDTNYKNLGVVKTTTNVGFSTKYREMLFGMDYIDNSYRVGISRSILDDTLTISSGILYKHPTFGIDYRYSIFNITIGTYRDKKYNSRRYQLSITTYF